MPNGYSIRCNETTGNQEYACGHDSCGEVFDREYGGWVGTLDTHSWTDGIRDHMRWCYVCEMFRCGTYVNFFGCGGCGDDVCSVCTLNGNQCCAADADIYDYGYKPMPIWFGGPSAPYYVGFELEITAHRAARPIYEWADENGVSNLFYCKDDSSVDGFEIVTHPMTPEFFHKFKWDEFFDLLGSEYPVRCEPVHNHGLHVHISRTAFERKPQLGRFSYLLQSPDNRKHVVRVARRESSWGAFSPASVKDTLPNVLSSRRLRARWQEIVNRLYESGTDLRHAENMAFQKIRQVHQFRLDRGYLMRGAVNLQNDATVEIRASGSTRVVPEFLASVDLVIGAADYARAMQPCHATIREAMSWDAFGAYVAGRDDMTPESRSIITGK